MIQIPVSDIYLKENQKCFVAGWGSTKSNGPNVQDLRVVDVSIINPEDCRSKWTRLPSNVICAGGMKTSKGFCQVCVLVSFVYKKYEPHILNKLIMICPPHRVILVVLWCVTA